MKGGTIMRLVCIVDNSVERGSTLWGEHGLCFLVQAETLACGGGPSILWDTGQSGQVLLHNSQALGVDSLPVEAVALSHSHHDHTGGLGSVLERHPGLTLYVHPTIFGQRFSRHDGETRSVGMDMSREQTEERAKLVLSDEPIEISPGIWTTGGIHDRPHHNGSSPHHLMLSDGKMVRDAYLDDMSLVLRVREGIVLLLGCCHAGLRNTLATVRQRYTEPLVAVAGGTHLSGASADEVQLVADLLCQEGRPTLYLNHCTGERAIWALYHTFGDRVVPCPAGTTIHFENKD